jgi:cell division protein FtsN
VRPGLPPPGTNKKYRIQVGSFSVASNAVYLFERLQDAGFTPNYEAYNNAMYRVVLAAITADDVAPVVERLGAFGIREVLIREER